MNTTQKRIYFLGLSTLRRLEREKHWNADLVSDISYDAMDLGLAETEGEFFKIKEKVKCDTKERLT